MLKIKWWIRFNIETEHLVIKNLTWITNNKCKKADIVKLLIPKTFKKNVIKVWFKKQWCSIGIQYIVVVLLKRKTIEMRLVKILKWTFTFIVADEFETVVILTITWLKVIRLSSIEKRA